LLEFYSGLDGIRERINLQFNEVNWFILPGNTFHIVILSTYSPLDDEPNCLE